MGNLFESRVRTQLQMIDKPSLTDAEIKSRLANYGQRIARERRVTDVYRSETFESLLVLREAYRRIAERRGIL